MTTFGSMPHTGFATFQPQNFETWQGSEMYVPAKNVVAPLYLTGLSSSLLGEAQTVHSVPVLYVRPKDVRRPTPIGMPTPVSIPKVDQP